jgi:hypothetical protein
VNVRFAVPLALMALLAGCGGGESDADRSSGTLSACTPGRGRPVSEATLKRVLAQRGIHLYRDDRCETFRNPAGHLDTGAPVATLRNTKSSLDYNRVVAAQGDIFCDIYPAGGKPEFRRIRYEGDEETHLDIANVSCAIYPEAPKQIDILEAGLRDLRSLQANS